MDEEINVSIIELKSRAEVARIKRNLENKIINELIIDKSETGLTAKELSIIDIETGDIFDTLKIDYILGTNRDIEKIGILLKANPNNSIKRDEFYASI